MTPQELQQITGIHQLFTGIETHGWGDTDFMQAAQFAKAHGADTIIFKAADGGNVWYGGLDGVFHVRNVIMSQGVGAIPYTYSYGNKFNALDSEIDILIAIMQQCGIACMDAEDTWNGQVGWASHLCARMQPVPGTFIVSTWSDPSLQDWGNVIQALAPCVTAFAPQQYTNYLATFWQEFGKNGASWLQPTVNLTQEFGANDPVTIAQNAYNQGHTAISVWYYETAAANPGLLDAVYAAFPKGGTPVQQYSPKSGDFDQYFIANADGRWTSKKFNTVLIGGNLILYSQLSIDGQTLPLIGLPRTNELYQTDESDGYQWSVQFFERGVVVYDPQKRFDNPPGSGSSYFGKYDQLLHLAPFYQPPITPVISDTVIADIKAVKAAGDKLLADAGITS